MPSGHHLSDNLDFRGYPFIDTKLSCSQQQEINIKQIEKMSILSGLFRDFDIVLHIIKTGHVLLNHLLKLKLSIVAISYLY